MGILQRFAERPVHARGATTLWQTETALLHAFALTRPPVAVQWIVTSACDLHCPHCYSSAGRRAKDELTTDEARTLLIDELARLGRPTVVFAGGEMSLRRDMPELIDHAIGKGLPYAIHTHGAHVERLREVFARHPPDLAAISLDGDEAAHDRFRGRQGSFAAALRAIRMLRDLGCPEIVVGTTVTRDNADHLAALYPIVAQSGAHTWGLHLFAPEGRGAEHLALLPTTPQLRRVVELARRRRATFHVELCNEWGSAGPDDMYLRDQPFACGAGRISFVVASNGDVMPCTTTDPAEREGNLRERALGDIWAHGFARFRRPGDDATLDPRECWLQTRNGVEIRRHAFEDAPLAPPLPLERLTQHLATRMRPTSDGRGRVASPRAAGAVRLAALGLAFLDGCVRTVVERATPEDDAARTPAADPSPSPSPPPPSVSSPDPEVVPETPISAERPHSEIVDEFPARLLESTKEHWILGRATTWRSLLDRLREADAQTAPWTAVADAADALGKRRAHTPLAEVVRRYANARTAGDPETFAELVGLLHALEAVPAYSAPFAAFIWRRARGVPANTAADERAWLYARLHLHLRVADALLEGQAGAAPVEFTAWRSKAAPPPGWTPDATVPGKLAAKAKAAFEARTRIPWDRVTAKVKITGSAAKATLVRDGRGRSIAEGETIAMQRLDMLQFDAPAVLRGPEGIAITVGAGDVSTFDTLATGIDAGKRSELAALIERAATDAKAEARVEAMLPWVHELLREAARDKAHPTAAKASLWLVTLDE
jgi:MoaA/NifB/PqqE/SkfB family radical SAM enzyme